MVLDVRAGPVTRLRNEPVEALAVLVAEDPAPLTGPFPLVQV
jgi:hypothetical protein